MASSPRRARRRRKISRAVKRNPIVAVFMNLLWPRTTAAPTHPDAVRAERYQVIGFGIALLALLIATTVFFFQARSEGAPRIDVDSAPE
jgi:hypothetical protein